MGRAGKLTKAGRKKRAGKHVSHAKRKPYQSGRRRVPDPYDAILDARSEARYEVDPRAEPEQWELHPQLATSTDEPEGAQP